MNFYGVRELSNNTKNVLSTVNEKGSAIITDNGKPTAILLSLDEENFEEMLAMVRQFQFRRTLELIQQQSAERFPNGMTMEEIDEEIAKSRKEIKTKNTEA